MPAKYSHVKKRSASGLLKKTSSSANIRDVSHRSPNAGSSPSPHVDRSISRAMSAVSQLERAIARILLLRYEQDIARLFSTRLYSVALVHLPTFVMRCISLGGPSWLIHNYDAEEIKDFFRAAMSMDMRQAGERVATKSVLWSYTALRHFAMSNGVPICSRRGLHSSRLLPYYPALQAHLDALEAMPPAVFSKPPHLGSLQEGQDALEDACQLKYGLSNNRPPGGWDGDWRGKVRLGYERLTQTLWKVAREFDVRGYGMVLREKLTTKWCDCGCSTDHLGEVCERTVREEEKEKGVRSGKQREWDGRGSGVYGWETEEEEDIWEVELDFGGLEPDEPGNGAEPEMTIGEIMEWRYFKAEREKEEGNTAFRKGEFNTAVKHYEIAHEVEPELPHYQLNLAAAHLKLSNWMEAEKACTKALSQHRSTKGYYRRARARRMLNRTEEAIKDLRAALKLQPTNAEAASELAALVSPDRPFPKAKAPAPIQPSSSKQAEDMHDASNTSGALRPRPPKESPYVRTRADERKLKIVLRPASAAEMALEELGRHVKDAVCAHADDWEEGGRDKDKKGKGKGGGEGGAKGKEGGKKRGGVSRFSEMEEIVRSGTVVYPSWDRYVVRRME